MPTPHPPPLSKPIARAHAERARAIYPLYLEFKGRPEHADWAVVFMFYTALHLVQAYLVEVARSGFDVPSGHTGQNGRDGYVIRKLTPISSQYEVLFNHSIWARYRLDKPRPTARDVQELETRAFRPIVQELSRRFQLGLDVVGGEEKGS